MYTPNTEAPPTNIKNNYYIKKKKRKGKKKNKFNYKEEQTC